MFGGMPQPTEDELKLQQQVTNATLQFAGLAAAVLFVAPHLVHYVARKL